MKHEQLSLEERYEDILSDEENLVHDLVQYLKSSVNKFTEDLSIKFSTDKETKLVVRVEDVLDRLESFGYENQVKKIYKLIDYYHFLYNSSEEEKDNLSLNKTSERLENDFNTTLSLLTDIRTDEEEDKVEFKQRYTKMLNNFVC